MDVKKVIYGIIESSNGWVNVDDLTQALKLNRTIITTTINSMMKSKTYSDIERISKSKTVGTGQAQRREFLIKYRVVKNEN